MGDPTAACSAHGLCVADLQYPSDRTEPEDDHQQVGVEGLLSASVPLVVVLVGCGLSASPRPAIEADEAQVVRTAAVHHMAAERSSPH